MRRALVAVLWLALALVPRARAQDDWSIERPGHGTATRPPRPRRGARAPHVSAPRADRSATLVDRYRALVDRDPTESFALARWVTLRTEQDGSPDTLAAEMAAARAADPGAITPRLVLAHLARRAGRADEARALYREIDAAHPDSPVGPAELARTEREAGALGAARDAYEIARRRARATLAETLAHEELEVLVLLGDTAAATALDAVLAGPHPSVDRRLELPRAWLAHQRPEAALEALVAIEPRVAGDPRARVSVRMERARTELALGRADDAIATLDGVLASARGGVRVEAWALAYEAHRQASSLDALASRLAHERSPEALALAAQLEDERGHDEAALAAYDRALGASPRSTTLRERRAHVLLRVGRVDEAAAALEALWRASPDEPDRLIEAASILVDAGRRDAALALLASASASRAHDARLHRRLAEVFARWGDDTRALAEARTLARIEPTEPESHALLGDLLLARGDRAAAIAAFHDMLARDATAASHDRLAMTLADHDLLEDARSELLEAQRLAPDDRTILQHLVDVLVRAGRDAEAEPLALRVAALSAGDAALVREARAGVVSIWARRRTLDRHVAELEAAFGAAPPDLAAGAMLAEALRRSGELGRAEEVLERLATLAPEDEGTWTTLERVRTLRGDLAGAIEALDQASRADPPRAASYLARMSEDAIALYRDEDAIRYAERALALAPEDAHGHVRLGDLQRRRQQTAAAIASYRRALALDPSLFDVAIELAELTRETGDATAADALYGQVIDGCPDDDLVARAIDASLEIELAAGDAAPLLDRLLTLSVAHYDRAILARAALTVLDAIARPLLPRVDASDGARAELHRVATRGLGVLLRALASPDPSEQRTALAILSAARVEAAATALLAASESHRDGTFGMEALLGAARVATATSIPRLRTIAESGEAQRARLATWAIARIGGPDAIETLGAIARGTSDAAGLALIGLAHLGDASLATLPLAPSSARTLALAALGHPLTSDECLGATRAIELLACAGPAEVAAALATGVDTDGAVRAATHRPSDLARAWPEPRPSEQPTAFAMRTIDAAPPNEPTPALRAALVEAVIRELRSGTPAAALHVLDVREGRLVHVALDRDGADLGGLDASRDAIADALRTNDEEPTLRALAARLLAQLRPADPRLDALLGDGSPAVARAALDGLAARPPGSAVRVAPLATILESSPDWVARLRAAEALGAATDGGETALIAALGGDSFAFVREAAARALGSRSGETGLEALRTAATGDPEERVRAAAAAALAQRGVAVR